MKNYTLEAVIVAVGLALMGFFVKNGLGNIPRAERTVTVKGLAEIEVPANKVTWPIVVKYFDDNLTVAYNKMKNSNNQLVDYLVKNGIKKEDITFKSPEVEDTHADKYFTSQNRDAARYYITSVVTVTSNDVDKVRSLIERQSELLELGIVTTSSYEYSTVYEYTDLNSIKPKLIEEATKNARVSAEKFAKDSDSKLGKIKTANQGQISIFERDANTPYIKEVRVVSTVVYYLED